MHIQCFTVFFQINTNSATKDSSKTIALSINTGFPNEIAIKPIAAMRLKQSALHDNESRFAL